MWTIARFASTSLFSLRPANATTSGGKSLLTPTPFSIKMSLLDVAIRVYGVGRGRERFPQIRDFKVAVNLPQQIMVNNTFIKILRPHKQGIKDQLGTGLAGPMGSTITYREFIQFGGEVQIALSSNASEGTVLSLPQLLSQVHYLGKRGGFMQFLGYEESEELPEQFTVVTGGAMDTFELGGTLQLLDDCGPKMTFDHANVYTRKRLGINQVAGRILRPVILPYRMARSSRGYTLYERFDGAGSA